ncbi:MAG: adenosine deaminase [Legionellaceae bacterium]|nr:adenosine deaminase [Legionellaceae bacterium]
MISELIHLRVKRFFCFLFVILFQTHVFSADINTYFNTIKASPKDLYEFFRHMPKGGELHYHFDGSAYPNALINQIKQKKYCINPLNYQISGFNNDCQGQDTQHFFADKMHEKKLFRSWTMKDFEVKSDSNSEHFFQSFDKTHLIYEESYIPLLADMMLRAARQHELYMEIIMLHATHTDEFANLIKNTSSLADKKSILLANADFQNEIQKQIAKADSYNKQVRQFLHCDSNPKQSVCLLDVRFQFFVSRNSEINHVFVEALMGFAATAQSSHIVGVNLVQSEGAPIARKDFKAQMRIFEFLHKQYPIVSIALHAGEFNPTVGSLDDLSSHIHDSVYIGHAKRIGHGVNILQEKQHSTLTNYMVKNQIAVEINLTSNHVLLSVQGKTHPILYYLQQNVPIVLSTDDEGVLLTNLSKEYTQAVLLYKLNYARIKRINRNALTYSFLPGKSIWLDPVKQTLVSDCQNLMSSKCKRFIKTSKKAQLQWQLENQLVVFENEFLKN